MAKKLSFTDALETEQGGNDVVAIVSKAEATRIVDIVKLSARTIDLKAKAEAIEVKTDEQESGAADILKEIKLIGTEAEALRKEKVNPFNALVKRINDVFRPVTADLESAEGTIKNKVLTYRQYKERLRQEEERKREEEYRRKVEEERKKAEAQKEAFVPPSPPPIIIPMENKVSGSSGSLSTRKVWRFKVVDIALVPDEFKVIDETAVRSRIMNMNANKVEPKISGLEIYQEETIASR